MKKLFTIAALLLMFIATMAQSRIGYTKQQIIEENYLWEWESSVANDGSYYIYSYSPQCYVIGHYFNKQGYSDRCIVMPTSEACKSVLVEQYNSKYVIVNNFTWKCYVGDRVIRIHLDYDSETNIYSFLFSEE